MFPCFGFYLVGSSSTISNDVHWSAWQIVHGFSCLISQKLTAAIGRNIERTTGKRLSQNGGDLSILKKVAKAAKNGGDESSKIAKAPKFNTKKQFRLTS